MKKLIYYFGILLLAVLVSSCAKWPEDQIVPETPAAGQYQLKSANATMAGDTIMVPLNTLVIFTMEKSGVKVVADFDFKNGTPVVTGDIVSTKFATAGVYLVTATDLSVTPHVSKTAIVKAKKDVIVIPPTSETSIIVISSTFTATGINVISLGLRCDVINAFSATSLVNAEVQYEMLPTVTWTKATLLASEITTVNTVKYYKWSITVTNGQKVRFSWLIGTSWAYASTCIFRQPDGLYVIYPKDGTISKEITASVLPGVFGDVKVRGNLEVISGAQNLVLYFQKLAFSGGTPTLKYKVGATDQTVVLTDAGDYYVVKIAMVNTEEINFWPLSTVGTVVISDSVVWNADKACGRIQILNLKSARIGEAAQPSVLLG